jgi:hypothetical protein
MYNKILLVATVDLPRRASELGILQHIGGELRRQQQNNTRGSIGPARPVTPRGGGFA